MARINLNSAGVDELRRAFGMPLALAETLVARRAELGGFRSWDDVADAGGLADDLLDLLKSEATLFEEEGDPREQEGIGGDPSGEDAARRLSTHPGSH